MNPSMKPGELVETMRWRYAVKRFDSERTVSSEAIEAIETALALTPSSYGMQPWKFLVVTDPALREAIVAACYGQPQPADCSHLVVLCARDDVTTADIDAHLDRTAEVQGVERAGLEKFEALLQRSLRDGLDPEQQRSWAQNQVYLALGQLLLAAAALGVDACPMEGFDPRAVDEILDLPGSGYHSAVLCPLGHRHPDDAQAARAKVRFPPERVLERR